MAIQPIAYSFNQVAGGLFTGYTLPFGIQASAYAITVTFASDVGTLPISAASLPLPAGAATAANQPTLNADGGALAHVTNFPATQPVSGTVALGGGAAIVGNMGSLNFQSGPVVPTISAAAYLSGRVIGGVIPVPVFRSTSRPSATLGQINLMWAAIGEAVPLTVYVFQRNPTSSTTNDGAAPSFAFSDLQYLACPPFVMTATAPVGSAAGFASAVDLGLPIQNLDSPPTANLYFVFVTGAATTPAGAHDLAFSIAGIND